MSDNPHSHPAGDIPVGDWKGLLWKHLDRLLTVAVSYRGVCALLVLLFGQPVAGAVLEALAK